MRSLVASSGTIFPAGPFTIEHPVSNTKPVKKTAAIVLFKKLFDKIIDSLFRYIVHKRSSSAEKPVRDAYAALS